MEEMITNIIERVNLKNRVNFGRLIRNSIKLSEEQDPDSRSSYPNIDFKLDVFFQGSAVITNECGKNKRYEAGVLALSVICDELGIDIEEEECFILFHLRNLGKFKMKESQLLQELKPLWKEYPKYAMEDREFSYAVKNLKKMDFISYRKSTIQVSKLMILRYRD